MAGGQSLPRLEVERIDVPRLERDRPVVVELEPVAGGGERLAPRGALDEAEHGAVLAELGAEVLVREHQAVARDLVLIQHKLVRGLDADPVRRRLHDRQLARRRPYDLSPLERRRVHRAAAESRERRRRDRVRAGLDLGQVALGVLVDEPDGRAGEDVVELLQEEELPQAVELLARVVAARDGREELGVVQRDLGAPVAALRARLGRVRAAVVLEVELAEDRRALARLRLERLEELRRRGHPRPRQALQIARAEHRLDHRARRPAAPVAVAVDEHRGPRVLVILVCPGALAQLRDRALARVRVGGREVRQHLAAVDPLPDERVVLGPVEAVPRELLRQEPGDPALAHDLRELAVVAEDVGVPELRAAPAEPLLEVPLAVQELPQERLARGDVAVGLDPGTADGHPAARVGERHDLRPQLRTGLLDPGVLLRLRAGEAVVRVLAEIARLRGERPDRLPVGLGERPEPGGVEVRVADGDELVRRRRVAALVELREDLGALRLGPDVAEAVELCEQLAGPGLVEAVLVGERAEDLEVEREPPRVGVEAAELAAGGARTARPARRRGRCRRARPRTRRRSPPAARSTSTASRWCLFSPCAGRPSSHSVASLAESQTRSTRLPAQSAGTVAEPRNQCVDHRGPKRSPSRAGRYSSCCASSRVIRSTGPATRSSSGARVSG